MNFHMKYLCSFLFLFWFTCAIGQAQELQNQPFVSVKTGPIASAFPFTGIASTFHYPFRPYVEVSYVQPWKKKPGKAEHELSLGYFYHRFMQHGIPIQYHIVRRFEVSKKFDIRTRLGGGYLHSIPAVDRFRFEDGEYRKIRSFGRPQGVFSLGIEGGYKLKNGNSVHLQYKAMIQAPFIKSYVPMLPYNSLLLGYSFPFPKS